MCENIQDVNCQQYHLLFSNLLIFFGLIMIPHSFVVGIGCVMCICCTLKWWRTNVFVLWAGNWVGEGDSIHISVDGIGINTA